MDDTHGGGDSTSAAEDLVLRTVAAHADSLLRTARRFSLCSDDAQDAYQRGLEIFMGHAERLDPARAAAWLHVVVKREAQAIRRSRQTHVASDDVDLDSHEARSVPSPDEQLATLDLIGRSAEALQRLKPQELRALWLRAQGHSYNDIGAITGWSYTKVNRCLTEGRRSFLARYADIESGAECERWLPVVSAMVDGEATVQQLVELRPHLRNCPGCRTTLRALQDSSRPLQAVFPIPLAVGALGASDHVAHLFTRMYEIVAGGLHDRAVTSFTKVQAVVEATAAGKAAAIAGAAAAVAGGGYATVERGAGLSERRAQPPAHHTADRPRPSKHSGVRPALDTSAQSRDKESSAARRQLHPREFASIRKPQTPAPEFGRYQTSVRAALDAGTATGSGQRRSRIAPSPEFAQQQPQSSSPEFGP